MMSDSIEPAGWDDPEPDQHCDEPDCLTCHPYTMEDYAP